MKKQYLTPEMEEFKYEIPNLFGEGETEGEGEGLGGSGTEGDDAE
jgi:hypothetical protein